MQQPVLPVLDLRDLHAGGEQKQAFLDKLAEAARTVGFFYVKGHQLCSLQQQVMALSETFFALPAAEKKRVEMKNSAHFRGYSQLHSELTQGKPDNREQFDIMSEEPVVEVSHHQPAWWKLIGPNQWPPALPQMQDTLLSYQAALTAVSIDLLHAFAAALGQPNDIFRDNLHPPYTHMKLIRYPGHSGQSNNRQGVGAHKDPGYLTIVTQDQQSGLEVYKDEQGWVSVPPLEGAVVINIGELLELASDGYLRATYHRVQSPAPGSTRYSCAFFMAAKLDSTVPLFDLPSHLKAQALGPSADPHNPLFSQVGENVLKGRLRSHPDVANAHYYYLDKAC